MKRIYNYSGVILIAETEDEKQFLKNLKIRMEQAEVIYNYHNVDNYSDPTQEIYDGEELAENIIREIGISNGYRAEAGETPLNINPNSYWLEL